MIYNKLPIGEKEYTFCACASVNVCYANIFHEDFIKLLSTGAEGEMASAFVKMAFVMAKYGELNDRKAVNQLTEDDYENWLDEFTTGDLIEALPEIQAFYMKSYKPAVDSKKNTVPLNE